LLLHNLVNSCRPGCGMERGGWGGGGLCPGSLRWVWRCRGEGSAEPWSGRIQGLIVCFWGTGVIGSCHYPVRAAVTGPADPPALIAVAFSSRGITRLTAKSCLSISAGGGRLHRPGSAGVTGLSARGHAPASGAFSPHPLPLALHLNPPTWPPRSFPRVLRLRKVQRGTIAGGQAVSDKRSILSSPARERAAGPVRGMCAVIGSGMREPSQPPVSTVTAVRCHPSVQLSPREGRHSFSLLTRCKCPLSGWILKILDTSLCLYAK